MQTNVEIGKNIWKGSDRLKAIRKALPLKYVLKYSTYWQTIVNRHVLEEDMWRYTVKVKPRKRFPIIHDWKKHMEDKRG